MTAEYLKKNFIDVYNSVGEGKFYRFLLCYAVNKIIRVKNQEFKTVCSPEIEYLNYSEKFLILYRHDDQEIYLIMSRIFRKAGNKIYRMMLKKGMIDVNNKFLNIAK